MMPLDFINILYVVFLFLNKKYVCFSELRASDYMEKLLFSCPCDCLFSWSAAAHLWSLNSTLYKALVALQSVLEAIHFQEAMIALHQTFNVLNLKQRVCLVFSTDWQTDIISCLQFFYSCSIWARWQEVQCAPFSTYKPV